MTIYLALALADLIGKFLGLAAFLAIMIRFVRRAWRNLDRVDVLLLAMMIAGFT